MDSPGFSAWKKRRAERAATSTDEDRAYEMFTAAMRGPGPDQNGRAVTGTPGGPASEGLTDAEIYQGYLSVLSGRAAELQAEETVRLERIEREQEVIRHVSQVGGGLSTSHEALRSRLQGFGKPHEGA